MAWPQAQEYNEAVQNPRICFTDADLKQGTVKSNPKTGIPIAISGGFASVYQVTTPTGKWAIRCLIKEIPDSQRRYVEISRTLNALRLPYTAPFEFQHTGIRIGSKSYPIVKMQWMTGELLDEYVGKNIYNQKLISELADKWAVLVNDLRSQKIAHGDLQHGNVLIVNHEIKLIDYDGMFVPSFQGMRSNEKGHPNFQHPRRQETDFGLHIDNFSAWVIYASLRILAASPDIYSLSRGLGRTDCLLFNREDFANPSASPIFGQVRINHEDTVIQLGQQIANLLTKAPKDVPFLDASLFAKPVIVSTPGNEWWRPHIKEKEVPPEEIKPAEPIAPVSVEIGPQPKAQREILGLIVASCVAFIGGRSGAIGYAGYFIVQIAIVYGAGRRLRTHFNKCPTVTARDRHYQEVQLKIDEDVEKKERLEQNRTKITENEQRERGLGEQLQATIAIISGQQGMEIKQVYTEQAVARAEFAKRKQAVAAEEERELRAATGRFESDARNVQSQINGLAAKKTEMCRVALEKLRTDTMNAFLSRHPVSGATLSGIGTRFKMNLNYSGIRTAADVTYGTVRVVDGFGQSRTATIMAWRQGLEAHYENRLPTQLSASDLQQVVQQSNAKRIELETLLRTIQTNLTEARSRVTRNYDVRRNQLAAEEQQIGVTAQTKTAAINSKHTAQIASRQTDFEQLRRNLQREIANARVSINSLESEIRRLHTWQREVGVPRSQGYESLTFARFCRTVLTSKFDS